MALQTVTLTSSSDSKGHTIQLILEEMSVDQNANTSSIKYTLKATAKSYSWSQLRTGWSISLNGVVVSSMARADAPQTSCGTNSSVTITSGTVTINHDADGTKTLSASASANNTLSGSAYLSCSLSVANAMVLTPIPRLTTLALPTTIVSGTAFEIGITKQDSTHLVSINYSLEQEKTSGTILTKSASTSVSATIPHSSLPKQSEDDVILTVSTFNSAGTLLGSSSYTVPISVPSTLKPLLNVTVSPINTIPFLTESNLYVAGYSRVSIEALGTPSTGSNITAYAMNGDLGESTSNSLETQILTQIGTLTENVSVTDRINRTTTQQITVDALEYTQPSATLEVERGTYSGGTWTPSLQGTHIKVETILTLGLASNGNTATVSIKLNNVGIITQTNQASGTHTYYYTGNVDPIETYTVQMTVTDKLSGQIIRDFVLQSAEVPLNMNFDLPGVAFGGMATKERTVQVRSGWQLELEDEEGNVVNVNQSIGGGGAGIKKIQRGKQQVSLSGKTNVDLDVTFPESFTDSSKVYVVLQANSSTTSINNVVVCMVVSKDANGFKARIWRSINTTSGNPEPAIEWFAFELS